MPAFEGDSQQAFGIIAELGGCTSQLGSSTVGSRCSGPPLCLSVCGGGREGCQKGLFAGFFLAKKPKCVHLLETFHLSSSFPRSRIFGTKGLAQREAILLAWRACIFAV